MTRALTIIGTIVAVLIGLILLAAVLVPLFFDPNDYKDEIASAVEEESGRTLSIDGDLSLSVFPWLAIGVGQATLSNAPGFGDQPFGSIDSARLSIRLLPLIRGQIEIGTVALDGLAVNLAVDENGRTNWEDLVEEEAPAEPEPTGEEGVTDFTVGSIEISGARVAYTDASTGASYLLEDFELDSGSLAPGEPFPLSMSFRVRSNEPALDSRFALETEATAALDAGRFQLAEPTIELNLSGEAVPGEGAMDVRVTADAIAVDTEAQTLELNALEAQLAGMMLRLEASGRQIIDAPQLTGTLEVPQFAPREVMAALDIPLDTADPGALSSASLNAGLAYGTEGIALEDLAATLDETRVSGNLRMPADEAAPIRFAFNVDKIDLDRYLPPPDETADANEQESAPVDDIEIPVDTLRGLRIDGSLEMGEVVLSDMRLQDVELGVSSDGREVRLHPLDAQFYGGTYAGDIQLDVAATPPRLSLDERVQGIQVGALTRDMYDLERISGVLNGNFRLAGTGGNLGAMRRTLGGDVNFELADGAIEGMDIWGKIRTARAVLTGQQAPEPSGAERTEITELKASGTVAEGILRNDDLVAQLPFLNVTGAGTINLVDTTLDYDLRATVVDKPELEAQTGTLTGKTVPVSITGTLSDPQVRPDVAAALKQRARERIEEEILERIGGGETDVETDATGEPAEERDVEEELKEKAREKLKDLFDN
ncbi:MAG: AsmA family protein [Gammaproteobacteria bacterium]